jgi:hypothetical protein
VRRDGAAGLGCLWSARAVVSGRANRRPSAGLKSVSDADRGLQHQEVGHSASVGRDGKLSRVPPGRTVGLQTWGFGGRYWRWTVSGGRPRNVERGAVLPHDPSSEAGLRWKVSDGTRTRDRLDQPGARVSAAAPRNGPGHVRNPGRNCQPPRRLPGVYTSAQPRLNARKRRVRDIHEFQEFRVLGALRRCLQPCARLIIVRSVVRIHPELSTSLQAFMCAARPLCTVYRRLRRLPG